MSQRPTSLLWKLRAVMSEGGRRRVRQVTDPLAGPLGSICGAWTTDPVIALTYDDGPDPVTTPGILDMLAQYGAKSTFFVLVERAEAHPDLIRRMLADGHDVGLHGLDHRRLTRLAPRDMRGHVESGFIRLAAVTGASPRWFRPPYGSQSLQSYLAARRCGMEVVVWSADCEDWVERPEQETAARAVGTVQPGSVLLLHDSAATDPYEPAYAVRLNRALITSLILQGLAQRSFRGTSVSALLDGRRAHRTAWFRP